MRVSTKARYGLRTLIELAEAYGSGPLAVRTIAERQEISSDYLEQVISPLRKAGLVKSVRGANGGYVLARKPDQITVGDVIRILEGPIAPVDCVSRILPAHLCERAANCVAREVWEGLRDQIEQYVDSVTLADLCKRAKSSRSQQMYYI